MPVRYVSTETVSAGCRAMAAHLVNRRVHAAAAKAFRGERAYGQPPARGVRSHEQRARELQHPGACCRAAKREARPCCRRRAKLVRGDHDEVSGRTPALPRRSWAPTPADPPEPRMPARCGSPDPPLPLSYADRVVADAADAAGAVTHIGCWCGWGAAVAARRVR